MVTKLNIIKRTVSEQSNYNVARKFIKQFIGSNNFNWNNCNSILQGKKGNIDRLNKRHKGGIKSN